MSVDGAFRPLPERHGIGCYASTRALPPPIRARAERRAPHAGVKLVATPLMQ